MKQDLYQAPDYFKLDELLTEEHKLIRDAAREWIKKEVSPIIEEACQKAVFPKNILPGLAEIGAFGPYIPVEYGGAGLDNISYGLIMQELLRRSNERLADPCRPWSRISRGFHHQELCRTGLE